MIRTCVLAIAATALLGAPAQAQTCPENFSNSGGMIRTWQSFPGLSPAVATDNLTSAAHRDGDLIDIRADRRLGLLTADNDGAGNGRMQQVRVVARRQGKGTRVDLSIAMQAGQVPGTEFRLQVCRFVRAAAGK